MNRMFLLANFLLYSPAMADDMPNFDTVAFCETVARNAGGSYQIEQICREQEERAKTSLKQSHYDEEIIRYCTRIGAVIGGSYQIMETCADQERTAKQNLQ